MQYFVHERGVLSVCSNKYFIFIYLDWYMVKYNWACHEHTSNSRNWFLEILCLECTHTKTVCGLFIHSLPELRMQIPLNQAGNNKMLMHQHNHSFYTTNILHNYLSLYNFWNFLFCCFKLTFSVLYLYWKHQALPGILALIA